MGFNSAFKGLMTNLISRLALLPFWVVFGTLEMWHGPENWVPWPLCRFATVPSDTTEQYLKEILVASFHILSSSLFIDRCTIRRSTLRAIDCIVTWIENKYMNLLHFCETIFTFTSRVRSLSCRASNAHVLHFGRQKFWTLPKNLSSSKFAPTRYLHGSESFLRS